MAENKRRISPKSICLLKWITRDGRICFEPGKSYPHVSKTEIALKGDGGIIMFCNMENYNKHFANVTAIQKATSINP